MNVEIVYKIQKVIILKIIENVFVDFWLTELYF